MRYVHAMLPREAPIDELVRYVENDYFDLTQKIDGHHCLMHIDDGRIAAIARSGKTLNVKPTVFHPFKTLVVQGGRWVIDGEYLDGKFYAFDIIEANGVCDQLNPYHERRAILETLWELWAPGDDARLVPSFRGTEAKGEMAQRILSTDGEGVVFKRLDAPFTPTNPATPDRRTRDSIKIKFRRDIDCVVTELRRGGKANMVLSLYDADGQLVEVGECSALTGDGANVKVGDVVQVTYLYATKDNRLYGPPVMPRIRTDKPTTACTTSQFQYANKQVHLT